ncbi:MAG: NUDIX domain-containing protein [Candidatus Moranbacteria bacterium]|nr:NUDIX domain-containing protein [Candidatus Moranbacteria bacterium]
MSDFELAARAVIIKNGRMLLCKPVDKDWYFFPGGHVEFGEKTEDALARELNEEMNIVPEDISFIGLIENRFERDNEKYHEIDVVFKVGIGSQEISEREDHIGFEWVDIESLKEKQALPIALKDAIIEWMSDGKAFWGSEEIPE